MKNMKYKIFRFSFLSGVHIGDGALDDNGINLHADTLFSALCIEALKAGSEETLGRLKTLVCSDELVFSDAFPFIDEEYYIPKPVFRVESEGDSADKKLFKNLKYIPLDMADDYLAGGFVSKTAKYISDKLSNPKNPLGSSAINARVAVRSGNDDPKPYHVGVYKFGANAGLYIIVGGSDEALDLFRELLTAVSEVGIGGKRSSGLGRFGFEEEDLSDEYLEHINGDYPAYITLSVSLPRNDEIEKTIENASYTLLRRSGFVFSETYSKEPVRKNDLYVLGSGSVVKNRFVGDVFDVSHEGTHPVYRYAKPLLYGVKG
ncbi:MAG: type III-A CRISPR-associated RAMP protein Csm4 [Oscillospiraceae bacterium]|nr:type III-A CRISPR-associated RAMP protein Csm4 [Oscillospiraceae bacterium]